MRDGFAGASILALFASLRFGSCAALTGAAALTGLRAVAGLRAAVLVVVVFVGICIPEKIQRSGHGLGAGHFIARPGSPDEWPHGFHAPSLHPRKEYRQGPR